MLTVFKVSPSNFVRTDVLNLTNSIKKYFMGQPNIVRGCKTPDFLLLGKPLVEIKSIFLGMNINPHEALFTEPMRILNTKSLNKVFNFFKTIQNDINEAIKQYKINLINAIKEVFKVNDKSSLKTGLTSFISSLILDSERFVLDDNDMLIENVIKTKTNYDDYQAVNELAKACTGNYIEDWEKDNSELFINALIKFRENVSGADKIDISVNGINKLLSADNLELDGIASLLSNSVESAIEEFSDSVSNEDKVRILANILKKYL